MNVCLYQCVWFAAVLGRGNGVLAITLTLAPIALHLWLVRERGRELAVMGLCAAVGTLIDSALALGGVFAFEPPPSPLPVPWWLVAIWLAFAATLRHALAPLLARAPLMLALGALGGPLSYLAAARLGAVSLPQGTLVTALVLSPVWLLVCAALLVGRRRLDATTHRDALSRDRAGA